MNEFAKQWVAALRSGKFHQGNGALKSQQRHCCLGVACELMADDLKQVINVWGSTAFDGEDLWLPDAVRGRLGLAAINGRFEWQSLPEKLRSQIQNITEITTRVTLVKLNDGGVPFDLIADVIEAEPEGLFA